MGLIVTPVASGKQEGGVFISELVPRPFNCKKGDSQISDPLPKTGYFSRRRSVTNNEIETGLILSGHEKTSGAVKVA